MYENTTKSIWKFCWGKHEQLVEIAILKYGGLLWTRKHMCTWNRRDVRSGGFAVSPDASLAKDGVRTVAGKNSLRLNTS